LRAERIADRLNEARVAASYLAIDQITPNLTLAHSNIAV